MTTKHSAATLRAHAVDLAKAFNVRLIESTQLQPEEAVGLSRLRVALVSTIIDETTYAVALHEMGHLASPTGVLRHASTGDLGNLMRAEEDAAWTWARHYALEWTPVMDAVARWAEATYAAPPTRPVVVAPPVPVAPKQSINWNDWSKK